MNNGYIKLCGIVAIFMSATAYAASSDVYKITSDYNKHDIKRSIDVTLNERIDADSLRVYSEEIRSLNPGIPHTFISWHLKTRPGGASYAISNFNPDYDGQLVGLSASDYGRLVRFQEDVKVWGAWIVYSGVFEHRLTVFRKGESYIFRSRYQDNSFMDLKFYVKKTDGQYRFYTDDPSFSDAYYLYQKNGDLSLVGKSGEFGVATKIAQ